MELPGQEEGPQPLVDCLISACQLPLRPLWARSGINKGTSSRGGRRRTRRGSGHAEGPDSGSRGIRGVDQASSSSSAFSTSGGSVGPCDTDTVVIIGGVLAFRRAAISSGPLASKLHR